MTKRQPATGSTAPSAKEGATKEATRASQEEPDEKADHALITVQDVLKWADAFHRRTGAWPKNNTREAIPGAPHGKTWKQVSTALRFGFQGLPRGWSLPRLLAEHRGVRNLGALAPLSEKQILAWADAFHAREGRWPDFRAGRIPEAPGESWSSVQTALQVGSRGLPRGSSLPRLLAKYRGVRNKRDLAPLSAKQILTWADAYHAREGRWPYIMAGRIREAPGESWSRVHGALQSGMRGLPGGSSLARFLAEHRGARNTRNLAPLSEQQILAWADAFHAREGEWPRRNAGAIHEAPGESWRAVSDALQSGYRGLEGGSSLARLLAARRGVRKFGDRDPLVEEQILAWADSFHAREGRWPSLAAGPIADAPGVTWSTVDTALRRGTRGLTGGSSLVRLLVERRGISSTGYRPPLSIPQILAWADAHCKRTGQWPGHASGPIVQAKDETWANVDYALLLGHRGLPGGSSLSRLLAKERGVRNSRGLPRLRIPEILRWADAYHARHSNWPAAKSGSIPEAPHETWLNVQNALYNGGRGLPGGSSLARLLAARRGSRRRSSRSHFLQVTEILAWADAHHARTGKWPNNSSGPITDAPGEHWQRVHSALYLGLRGLPAGSSLARLLAKHRGVRNRKNLPRLTIAQVLTWADAYHTRTGRWPRASSGPIAESPDDNWSAISHALLKGCRGFPGGSSLARLLAKKRGVKRRRSRC
jgi:hypothetical protein